VAGEEGHCTVEHVAGEPSGLAVVVFVALLVVALVVVLAVG
jgi:hypothetical protein